MPDRKEILSLARQTHDFLLYVVRWIERNYLDNAEQAARPRGLASQVEAIEDAAQRAKGETRSDKA